MATPQIQGFAHMIYGGKTSEKTGPAVGLMDRRVIIRDFTMAANDYGEPIKTWSDTATVWCAVEYPQTGSGENYVDAVNLSVRNAIFTMRYRDGITEKTALVLDDRQHDITRIAILGRNEYLRITAEFKE